VTHIRGDDDVAWLHCPDLRFSSAFPVDSVSSALISAEREYREGRGMRLYIFEDQGALTEPVGDIALSEIVPGPFQACYLGYRIDMLRQGRGYATESVKAVVEYAFQVLNLHRIMANYIPSNEPSGRVLRQLGFTEEGFARDYLYLNGKWRDHILTSLTNPGWRDARADNQ
jgi:ribosomal-protein-alanine N-acetyltransferase